MGRPSKPLWFDKVGDAWVGAFGARQQLVHDAATNAYRLYDLNGETLDFDAPTGMFRKQTAASGHYIAVTAMHSNGYNFTQVERTATVDGVAFTDRCQSE